MGFNSQSGKAIGTALDVGEITENKVVPGAQVQAQITMVNSHEEIMEKMGMSFEAQGRYGAFTASLKSNFAESSSYNSTSTFLVARCIVTNSFVRGRKFRVTPEAEALLKSNRFVEFNKAFGDSFVRGIQTGGEFYCIIRITSFDIKKQAELSVALQAEFNGLVAAGEFKGQFNKANQSSSTRSEYMATMYQRGGKGEQIKSIVEISEAIQRFKDFPIFASQNPVGYETEIATYDTIPLPLPTPEEQENFTIALRDAREKKLYYIQKRNDLEFAFRQPEFFEELPAPEILQNGISVYSQLINAVMDHGIRLSRGEIKTPTLFTPTINEPTIKLKRKPPEVVTPPVEMVKVPDIVNLPVKTADSILNSLGLNPNHKKIKVSAESPVRRMHVERQSPPPGTEVKKGSDVDIIYFCTVHVLGTIGCRPSSFRHPYFHPRLTPFQHYEYPYLITRQIYPFFYTGIIPLQHYENYDSLSRQNYPYSQIGLMYVQDY